MYSLENRLRTTLRYHDSTYTYLGRVADTFGAERLHNLHLQKEVLDWGCSKGLTTVEIAYFAAPHTHVTGLDCNKEALGSEANKALLFYRDKLFHEKKKKQLFDSEVGFQFGNGYRLSEHFEEDQFNAVFMMNNLYLLLLYHEIEEKHFFRVIRYVRRYVEVGGNLCIGGVNSLRNHGMIFEKDRNGKAYLKASTIDLKDPKTFSVDQVRAEKLFIQAMKYW